MTKFSLLSLLALLLLVSCKQANQTIIIFDEKLQHPETVEILPTDQGHTTRIKLQDVDEDLKASQLVDDFKYIFLETTPESLLGSYGDIVVHNGHIFILDYFNANAVCIFDLSGKFIKQVPKGGGPGECLYPFGMYVDKKQDQLVVYDAGKRKFMFYSLDGEFLDKSIDIQLYFAGVYAVLDDNNIVYMTERSLPNPHIEELDEYRLLYTDSTGCVKKATLPYDDNKELQTSWHRIHNNVGDILLYPKYTSDFYSITEQGAKRKYTIDLSAFSPASYDHIRTIREIKELYDYLDEKTSVDVNYAETEDKFFFTVSNKKQNICAFYDKKSKQTKAFYNMVFDNGFMVNFPDIYSDDKHFIGSITPQQLKNLSQYRQRENRPLDKELEEKIANLQEDDNAPLVLFTVK